MRLGAAAPRYPKGTNLRNVNADPSGARGAGCGTPYWAAARGYGTEKGCGPRTAPGGRGFAPPCAGGAASGGGATYEAEL